MNALSVNIPANFIATCEATLKRHTAAQTDADAGPFSAARPCRASGGQSDSSASSRPLT